MSKINSPINLTKEMKAFVDYLTSHPGKQAKRLPAKFRPLLRTAEALGVAYWRGPVDGWHVTALGLSAMKD